MGKARVRPNSVHNQEVAALCNGEWSRGKEFRLARPVPKSLGATVSRRDARSFGVGNRSTEKHGKTNEKNFGWKFWL